MPDPEWAKPSAAACGSVPVRGAQQVQGVLAEVPSQRVQKRESVAVTNPFGAGWA